MDWTMWLEWVIKGLVLCLILLAGFAYLTWYERRALARMQVRVGPNRAGFQGLLPADRGCGQVDLQRGIDTHACL